MGTRSTDTGTLADAVTAAARARPAAAWRQPLRQDALRRLASTGLPTPRLEDWRYTDLGPFAERTRRLALATAVTPGVEPLPAGLADRLVTDGVGLTAVFHHGTLVEESSRLAPPPGVTLGRIDTPASRDAWEASLAADSVPEADATAALNAAMISDGLAIEIAANRALSQPLYVACAAGPDRVAHDRLLLRLRAGSVCTLIEHHLGSGAGAASAVTDVVCEAGARLIYVRVQDDPQEGYRLSTQRIHLEAGAEASFLAIDIGGALVRNSMHVTLGGAEASATIHGLFIADGHRHIDNQTRVDHRARGTRCREAFRGIVDGQGRGIFNGKIIVHPGADQADAELRNENLLLSREAEVDTKPELEIYADDVKCAHGATTGQLDATAVFYLRSRGLGEAEARRMLLAAFAREIIARLPVEPLEAYVVRALAPRLPDLADVGAGP